MDGGLGRNIAGRKGKYIFRVSKCLFHLEYSWSFIEEVSNVKCCYQVAGWYPERMMLYQDSAFCWQIEHSVGLEARLDFVNGSPCY